MNLTHRLLGVTLALAAGACAIDTGSQGSSGNQPGDGGTSSSPGANVYLELSFAGSANCYAQKVDEVTATFAGGALTTATVPCNSAGGIAIEYADVLPGAYSATIIGTLQGTTVFGGEGTFTVQTVAKGGTDQYYSFNLPVYSGGTTTTTTTTTSNASVTLAFTFGQTATTAGLTCAQAQVTNVTVSVDGATATTVPCHDSATSSDTATLSDVSVGTHSIDLSVLGTGGAVLYHSTLTGVVVNSGNNDVTANIAGATPGGLTLSWAFSGGGTCTTASVAFIQYTLVGPNQQTIAQGATACSDSSVTFSDATGQPLSAGQYTFSSVAGIDSGGNQVYPSSGPASGIAVPAGVTATYTATLSK